MTKIRIFLRFHFILFSMFVVPQFLLYKAGIYNPKLGVEPALNGEFLVGLIMAAIFFGIFALAAIKAKITRHDLHNSISALARRNSFKLVVIILTLALFAFLMAGIGTKQSEFRGANFIIMLFPRDLVIVGSALCAFVSRKPLWIAMTLVNAFYWVLVGSKAAIFYPAMAIFYFWLLTEGRFRVKTTLLAAALGGLLYVSFSVPALIVLAERVGYERAATEAGSVLAGSIPKIAARVSWLDGMAVSADRYSDLVRISGTDMVLGAVSRVLPGFQFDVPTTGRIVIPLYRANSLTNFAGAVGIPGTMKMMLYNAGIFGFITYVAVLYASLFIIFRMVRSRDPNLVVVGMSALAVSAKSLFISGNLDTAIGLMLQLMISGLAFVYFSRFMLKNRGIHREIAPSTVHETNLA